MNGRSFKIDLFRKCTGHVSAVWGVVVEAVKVLFSAFSETFQILGIIGLIFFQIILLKPYANLKETVVDPVEAQFNAFSGTFEIFTIAGLVFLLAVAIETLWDVVTGKRPRLGETASNSVIALVSFVLELTAFGLVFVIGLIIVTPFALFEIPYTWWSWVLAVLLADFTYYWMHRIEHEVRILWAYHSVHHSSPEFNFSTALRLAWIESLFEWVFFVPMILAGFDLVQTIIAIFVVVAYQNWIHTQKVGKLGWLDRVFNTPSVHRVHHGCNANYLDKNYGGILIIWDRLFGTYEPEGEKVIYGITEPVNSINPLVINFCEYWRIAKDVMGSKTVGEAFGYLFRGPGWAPEPNPAPGKAAIGIEKKGKSG